MAEVVAAAGVERVTFYRHFESVAALLAAVDVQRTTEGERDEALTVLVRSASVGLLDVTELTHRADVVLRASSWRELRAVLADLPHTGAFTAPAPRSCR